MSLLLRWACWDFLQCDDLEYHWKLSDLMNKYQSWGQYPPSTPHSVFPVYWASDTVPFETSDKPFLPYAHGRSYGDSCLNDQGNLLDVSPLRRFIAFDEQTADDQRGRREYLVTLFPRSHRRKGKTGS